MIELTRKLGEQNLFKMDFVRIERKKKLECTIENEEKDGCKYKRFIWF
jgi:hypothetical protein